ncbi:hypothetical protein G6F46_003387 [Rhizopus delemar]|uniref:SET domain-containing protein n=3 Tax=Rhizopus TaxID=4842 RepID=I1BIB5_RHIO9|nr:hypothetical protein RO3G_00649 [Rhizopus delemar RA 99-880]KAG1056699.1 hypothetical protein G6F43_001432 [Rhizopus delemar]KAG1548723.1 hypothetical protein G6F51_003493 [Rhizopus arrhizus]KAG1463862.1 hypothetical protein G6F55_002139 [Rhizopus delemar]KAG1501973.1 hypothetical protein G6F54_002673 [Rhizopus delemar]|eukprot:EIE75945.1 hypothetical protein RO3G_00649 [Rhizopus delemar RA 99-880]
MMATEDIEAGEVIVSVPRNFLITNESLTKLYGTHSLSPHQLLALHLVLLTRDKQSWWKPYTDLLPMHFNTMPVNYPSELLSHLPNSLKQETMQQKDNIHTDYVTCLKFCKSKQLPQDITAEEFKWAWLCVNTRCIHMTVPDYLAKGENIALAPMLDFLNHTTEAKIESGFNIRTQRFEIKTLTAYKKGEQVYINYGPHDNLAMLKEYGFVLNENIYNFVLLDDEIWSLYSEVESKKGLKIKKEILEGSGYAGDYSIKKNEISFRLMAALRLLALDGTTNSGFDRRVMDWHDVVMGQIEYINSDNERKAYLMLESVCKQLAVKAKNELHVLSQKISEIYPKAEIHPFALYFSIQIWKESSEIIDQTLEYLSEKLSRI